MYAILNGWTAQSACGGMCVAFTGDLSSSLRTMPRPSHMAPHVTKILQDTMQVHVLWEGGGGVPTCADCLARLGYDSGVGNPLRCLVIFRDQKQDFENTAVWVKKHPCLSLQVMNERAVTARFTPFCRCFHRHTVVLLL